jgi:hypothetical protein
MNVLKLSWVIVISHVIVELKTNVSEILFSIWTLKMETEELSEAFFFSTKLTRLIAQENFTTFCVLFGCVQEFLV